MRNEIFPISKYKKSNDKYFFSQYYMEKYSMEIQKNMKYYIVQYNDMNLSNYNFNMIIIRFFFSERKYDS